MPCQDAYRHLRAAVVLAIGMSACNSAPPCESVRVSTIAGNGCLAGAGTNAGCYSDGTGGPAGTAEFSSPTGIALDSLGNAYVADLGNNRIREIDTSGNVTTIAGGGNPTISPCGGGLPTANPIVCSINAIATVQQDSIYIPGVLAGETTYGPGVLAPLPTAVTYHVVGSSGGIALDANGNVYTTYGSLIHRIDTAGNVTVVAGNGNEVDVDGTGGPQGTASFHNPIGIAANPSGYLYVADDNRIRVIDLSGNVGTLAGSESGFADGTGGPGGTARFNAPQGVAVDANGNVFVADTGNNSIRLVNPAGNVTTLAGGGPTAPGFADGTGGPLGSARLNGPIGIAIDATGNIFVADQGNNRIRFIPKCQ